jgi:predicted anti-sigma-YlaC factor YlaD
VSIINRLRLSAHLDEAALVSLWTDGTLGGSPLAHPHLERCAACRNRFAELASWLETIRVDAVAEADEHFPAERLAAQNAQIFRRLEAAERPARVIAFPTFTQPLTSRSSHASRWIAAAAAAGLIVGVGVGQLMDLRHALTPRTASTRLATTAATVSSAATVPLPKPGGREELFLSCLFIHI